ncbi:MAG: DUF3440 domain-containing protein, partial [Bacteroidota bacterium]
MHLFAKELRKRNQKIGLLIVDLEAQYKKTIEHIKKMVDRYSDCFEVFWVALPLHLRNAVSVFEPQWICWDKDRKDMWVREQKDYMVTDYDYFPFYEYAMEFEDFVAEFIKWYSQRKSGRKRLTSSAVGIRTQESLNRWKAIHQHQGCNFLGKKYLNKIDKNIINSYPIYDWKTEDIWKAVELNNWEYNTIYDDMYQSGKSIHDCRICQPYGDDQRRGLDLFRKCEPETWEKVVNRVSGANYGNLYCGSVLLGNRKVELPKNMTWKSYLDFLLKTIPKYQAEWYKSIFKKWFKWWEENGTDEYFNNWLNKTKNKNVKNNIVKYAKYFKKYKTSKVLEEAPQALESRGIAVSYKRMVKAVYKNDILCHSLGYGRVKNLYYILDDFKKKYGE